MNLLLILPVLAISTAIANAQYATTDRPATHGMLLMGIQTVYASHLPMFHSPHDYQIILELSLSADALERYRVDRKAHKDETVYTLEPEVFVLPDMVNHTRKVSGRIHRGHFERGGVIIVDSVSVEIKKVIYFKKFTSEVKPKANLEYLLFGDKEEQFLAHRISQKPDFDEVLAVVVRESTVVKKLEQSRCVVLEFNEHDLRKPFSWKTTQGKLLESKQTVSFDRVRQLYLEFSDLE